MKMNLSVVMKTIDKMSGPIKSITATQSKYAKQLSKVQQQSLKISNNQALISHFRKTSTEATKHKQKLNDAQQKLSLLNAKMSAAKKPSSALQNQFKKQQQAVKKLKITQGDYTNALTKAQNKMKTAGVNVKRLSSEEKRLSTEYAQRIKQMDTLAQKEQRLQKIRAKLSKFKLPNVGGAAMAKGGALLGGLSFAGLFATINGAAGEMDKLAKASGNLNMPIEELQAMQSQAEHAGVSADTMTSAMSRFTKRLGVLQTTGAGAMGAFLKKGKNPLYRELKNANSTQQAYDKLLGSFSKLKTNQEQMAFADAAFGGDGRRMLILLREGTKGLTSARKEFNALGGGVTADDAKKAEAYNDALQKIQEAIRSIKFAALAPLMEKITKGFTAFSDKFKNTQWRTEMIQKVTDTVTLLYQAFKTLGKGLIWASQHLPEIIAGIVLLKIAMFALNAAMMSNPIGLIVAGVMALITVVSYLIAKVGGMSGVWNIFTNAMGSAWQGLKNIYALIKALLLPVIDSMSTAFHRVQAGFTAGVAIIKTQLLLIPRAIMKMLSLIPDKLLPDGWGENIKSAQKQLEKMNGGIIKEAKTKIEYAINGEHQTPLNNAQAQGGILDGAKTDIEYAMRGQKAPQRQMEGEGMLRHPSIQSKSQVEVRIKSDKPIEIAKVQSDNNTEMVIDTGDLMGVNF